MIHTSKKKVIVETKGGRTATKIKTIVTTNEIKRPTPPAPLPLTQSAPEAESNAKRRSNRTKQATSKILESMPSPTRNSLTNGIPRSSRSPATAAAATAIATSTNAKYQNNLLAELSKKSTNYSPDVVSDLEEILGSPIKTHDNRSGHVSRKHAKAVPSSPKKASSTIRSDCNKTITDDEAKPATRSSKRLSGRAQPISNADSKAKTTRNSSASARGNAKKPTSTTTTTSSSSVFHSAMLSEESQGSQDESYSNLQMEENNAEGSIVMNIKQEKEVSFTLTDDNAVFTCEMCSAVFSDRAQLLVHVPVHI